MQRIHLTLLPDGQTARYPPLSTTPRDRDHCIPHWVTGGEVKLPFTHRADARNVPTPTSAKACKLYFF